MLFEEPAYAGAAVAAVAADSARAAADALVALDPVGSRSGSSPTSKQALENQTFQDDPQDYERGDVESALAAAEVRVETEYRAPAQLHNSMEPHCAVADWRPDGLTVWSSTQAIYQARGAAGGVVRARPRARAGDLPVHGRRLRVEVRVRRGGGVATGLSRRAEAAGAAGADAGATRTAAGFRTPARMQFTIGARPRRRADGRGGVGGDGARHGRMGIPGAGAGEVAVRVRDLHLMTLPMRQNLGPAAAFRAPGVMEGTYGFEQALDELAEKRPGSTRSSCGGVTTPSPTPAPAGLTRPSGCWRATTSRRSWRGGTGATRCESDGRVRRGMGCASQYWWGGGGPPAYADVRIGQDARPVLTIGTQDLGTGVVTASAIVVAERLGVRPEAGVGALRRHGSWPATGRSRAGR